MTELWITQSPSIGVSTPPTSTVDNTKKRSGTSSMDRTREGRTRSVHNCCSKAEVKPRDHWSFTDLINKNKTKKTTHNKVKVHPGSINICTFKAAGEQRSRSSSSRARVSTVAETVVSRNVLRFKKEEGLTVHLVLADSTEEEEQEEEEEEEQEKKGGRQVT